MPKPLLLGCIADDFTGATDLANNLVRAGMRVVQTIGVPTKPLSAEVDAVVPVFPSDAVQVYPVIAFPPFVGAVQEIESWSTPAVAVGATHSCSFVYSSSAGICDMASSS